MIHPFLNMTIKGAVWYQGEANAGTPQLSSPSPATLHHSLSLSLPGAPDTYNCTFPAMIDDWRTKWRNASNYTDPVFPFGFVQVTLDTT